MTIVNRKVYGYCSEFMNLVSYELSEEEARNKQGKSEPFYIEEEDGFFWFNYQPAKADLIDMLNSDILELRKQLAETRSLKKKDITTR